MPTDFFKIGAPVFYGHMQGIIEGRLGRLYRVLLTDGSRVHAPAGDLAKPGEDIAYSNKDKAWRSAAAVTPRVPNPDGDDDE